MKYVDADKIAVVLGKMPILPDFDVRGEIGNAPYCVLLQHRRMRR